jgi:hypothetical protein
MLARQVGRAGALAAAASLLLSGMALADSVAADGDVVTAGVQTFVDLGTVGPGATISRDVNLTLFCSGIRHVDPDQDVTVSQTGGTVPAEGGSVTATGTTIGPVPVEWANDTAGISGCSGPLWVDGASPSHVTIVAPSVAGQDYAFTVTYGRSLAPAGVADSSSISGFTLVTFVLDVADADSSPPTFTTVPGDLDVVTPDPAGIAVDYPVPSATDDRDPSPVVGCDPASGAVFPVGTTTVTCTATDASGNAATETFDVTVHLALVAWEDPIQGVGVTATRGRSVPVKVRAWLDGVAQNGAGTLVVTPCGAVSADATTSVNAAWQADAGRWMAVLDTSGLGAGCYRVELVVGGQGLGSFGLDIVAPPKTTTGLGRAWHRPS